MNSIHRWIPALLLAAFVPASMTAQQSDNPSPAVQKPGTKPEVPKPAEGAASVERGKAAIEELRRREKELKGVRGPARLIALQQIAERGEQLATDLAGVGGDTVGRVWFMIGEAWRRQGNVQRAATAYEKSVAQNSQRYLQRGLFQLAQMQRRMKQLATAIANYRKAAGMSAQTNRAHEARVWVARCLEREGDAEAATASYRAAVEAAATARQCIDASNWLAKSRLRSGDLDGAAAAIGHADKVVRAEAVSGKEHDALEKALSGMSARRALQRARDKATDASGDAIQLEKLGAESAGSKTGG